MLNMVMVLFVVLTSVTDSLGHWHCLFAWFVYGLVDQYCFSSIWFMYKSLINEYVFGLIRKVNVSVQPHPNFHGRNCGINVISKQSVKESKHAYKDMAGAPSNSCRDDR